jgi:hypothetical protein
MHRTVGMAVIALAAVALLPGIGAGAVGAPMASVVPAASRVAPKPGGPAMPHAKKLSGKGGAACFRACMHGVSGAGWGNFCDYSCYGN